LALAIRLFRYFESISRAIFGRCGLGGPARAGYARRSGRLGCIIIAIQHRFG
jgi:hypothetical protein